MSAFILALVMILGMIPTGIFKLGTSAAEPTPDPDLGKTFLHASYAASVNVDGAQDDGYRFDIPVGSLRLGAAWNKGGLYLSFNSADPKITTLKINGAAVDLTSAVKATDTCTEYKLPLPEDLNAVNTLSVKLEGESEVTLQLLFETNNYKALKLSTASGKGNTLADNVSTGKFTATGNVYVMPATQETERKFHMKGSVSSPMIVEFDMDIIALPNNTTPDSPTWNNAKATDVGINVEIIDAHCEKTYAGNTNITELMKFGFYNDNGKLVMRYIENGKTYKTAQIAATAAGLYHVRVEYTYETAEGATKVSTNDVVNAKYFINGECVAEAKNVRTTLEKVPGSNPTLGTGNTQQVRVRPSTDVNVTLANYSVSYDQAGVELVKDIASLGELVSLDTNAVTELRKTYEALGDTEKAQVANLAALEAAETYLSQTGYIHADFVANGMTVDGTLESAYRLNVPVTETVRLGAAWDGKNLYLAFRGVSAVTELKVRGQNVTAVSQSGTDTVEYQIALKDLIPDYTKAHDISFKIGDKLWTGKLTFDTVTFAANVYQLLGSGTEATDDKKTVIFATSKSTYSSGNKMFAGFGDASATNDNLEIAALSASTEAPTVVEFDLTINQIQEGTLPGANGLSRDFCKGGVGFTVIDDLESADGVAAKRKAFLYGLCKIDGVLSLVYWDNGSFKNAPVDIDGVGDFHVRAEFSYTAGSDNNLTVSDAVSAKYYVNGKLVAEGTNVRASCGSLVTTYSNYIQVIAQGAGAGDVSKETNAVLKNVSVSKTNPKLLADMVTIQQVESLINAIGEVTLDREAAIQTAKEAYDGLDPLARPLVSNASTLAAAESQLKILKNSNLHALFATTKVTVDGKVNEAVYKRVLPLSGTLNVSAAWDATNLYLAFAGAANPNVTALKVNGYNIDLSAAKTGTGTWEIAIPLDSVGMGSYTGDYTISFQADGKTWSGKLVLDTADHAVATYLSVSYDAQGLAGKNGATLNTYKGTSNTYRSSVIYLSSKLSSVADTDSVLEFDFEPTYLPENSNANEDASRGFLTGGVSFTVRDEKDFSETGAIGTEAFLFGFGKQNGELKLYYCYFDAAAQSYKAAVSSIPQSNKYHVRVEYTYGDGDAVTARYYVNGVMIVEQDNSRITAAGGFSTSHINSLQVYATVGSGKQSETNKIIATIKNVSFGHTQPELIQEIAVDVGQVEQLIDQIGTVTLDRAGYIESTLARFESLSATAQTLVKNADVLFDAVEQIKLLENSYLHAVFATDKVTLDGNANENCFRRCLSIGNAKFGAAWDDEYLYLYFEDTAVPSLVINGVTVTTTGTAGAAAREYKIPLSQLNIQNLADSYPVSIVIGKNSWSGKLVLDTVDYTNVPHGTLSYGAIGSDDKLSFTLDTYAPDVNQGNTYRSMVMPSTNQLGYIANAATVVEFGFDPIYMPDNCTASTDRSRNFLPGGVAVVIRDDRDVTGEVGKMGYIFGFGKVDGKMKLYYFERQGASTYNLKTVNLSESDQYYVRVEYIPVSDDVVKANYYINGVLVAESANAWITNGSMSTSHGNIFQFYARVANGEQSDTNKVVATVSNLSVGHMHPGLADEITNAVPQLEAQIAAIGSVTAEKKADITAAREAYNALSDLAKTLVSNVNVLDDAEARLNVLENSYLHAAFSSTELTLDGKIFEPTMKLNVPLSETLKLGAVWTKNYLYLAFQGETVPTVSDLVINGKTVKITASNSKTGAVAREIRISLSTLGIVGYDKTYPISFKAGDINWSGTLVQDSHDFVGQTVYMTSYGAYASADKTSVYMNSVLPDASGGNTTRSLALYTNEMLQSVANKATIMEFDLDINHLPENSTAAKTPMRNFLTGGFAFTIRDEKDVVGADAYGTQAFLFGLGKVNGKLMLYHWYYDAESNTYKCSKEAVPEAEQYHLRVEYGYGNGNDVTARYYINSLLIAESASARVKSGSYATRQINSMQVYANASDSTESNRVDITLNNLSISHPKTLIIDDKSAAAYVDELITAIGEVTLESAEAINKARETYHSLTAAQKKLVTKLSVLEAAEAKLQALKDARNQQYTNYVFAEYYTDVMTIDGKLNEKIWRAYQPIFGTDKLALVWDFNYLYLAISGSNAKNISNLKLNGQPVSETGKLDGNVREMKILLSSVGIKAIDFMRSYELSFTLGGKTWSGELIFDTGTFTVVKPGSVVYGATKSGNSAFLNTENSTSGTRQGTMWNTTKLTSQNGFTTIIELDVKVDYMPNNHGEPSMGRQFANGGISITIRDEDTNLGENGLGDEALLVGFVREKGQMMLMYWEDSIDAFVYEPVEDYGTGRYHLRVEYFYYANDDVTAKYYVNGMLVAESLDAKELAKNGYFGTSGSNVIQVFALGSATGPVKAEVTNLSVSQNRNIELPEPLDALTKDEIFAKLDLNHIQQDLNLPKEFVTVNGERFKLTWITSDSSVVTSEGKVTRPLDEASSATLTLIVDGEEIWSVTIKVDPMSLCEAESPANVDAAFSKAPIVIDGILEEEGWRMSGRVLDKNKQLFAEYGFQWTQNHLYIAVEYMEGMDTLSLKLNGRYFTVHDGKLYRGGENVGGSALIVTNGNVMELRIPLNVLGLGSKISSYGVTMPMSLKAGPYVGGGKTLTLSGIDWFVTENRNHEAVNAKLKSNDAYHGVQRLVNGYRLYDLYGGSNAQKVRSYVSFLNASEYIENFADRIYDTRIEFDFIADALPILPTDGSAYTNGGAYGMSGFTCCAGEITGADGGSLSFNYGIINTIQGLMFVLNVSGNIQTHVLNKGLGEKFSIGVEWTKEDTLLLFIDGVLVNSFYCPGHWGTTAANASLVINMRPLFEPQSVADNYDVSITNLAFGKVHRETGILAQLTFDTIRNKNSQIGSITSDLILPTSITNGQMDKVYSITWTSSKPNVVSNEGKVTRPAKGLELVTLTATLPTGETKAFELVVQGRTQENDGVLHVLNDTDPANGRGVNYKSAGFTFDATNNSIIKVMDGKQKVNFVVLTDGDDKADLTPETLTLWVSNDNQTYTRVKDYKLLQIGEKWYLYDFEAEGTYIKVHYTKPEEEGEFSTFFGAYGGMINAGYETVFGGGNAVFTKSQYILTNNTGKDQLDYAWTISKKDLGITGTDASIRIYADGKLLYHYVSGSNVVVRVNDMPKGASVTLTVLSSTSKDVMDISNKEGVHEVIYGVMNTILSSSRMFYLSLPAGTKFPDGSVLEKDTVYAMANGKYQTSTDAGITWQSGSVYGNAPEGKEPVTKVTSGGWIFDSKTGRIMFETYVHMDEEMVSDGHHMHTTIIISDDGGKTWYFGDSLPCRVCTEGYIGNLDYPAYALSYNDGIELSTNDGKGPNVDFVFPLGARYDNIGSFASRVAYTKDGGDTWHYSSTPITYPSFYGLEGGCSEGWIMEREDGVLVIHIRCQDETTCRFKVCYSYDHGLTWTNDHIFTNYYAANGQPWIRKMDVAGETTVIAAWGGNTSLGGTSYHRNPFVFASSANDGETFRNIQNIVFRSFEEQYDKIQAFLTTNVSLVSYGDGNILFSYNRNGIGDKVYTNVEDFDLWFTRTKGAYDNFEKGTLRGEGWNLVGGVVELSDTIAKDKYALKLNSQSMAIRSIPYLQDGKLSIDIYVEADSSLTVELQSAHTRYYDEISVPIALRIENGKLYFNSSNVASADNIKEGWNTLTFDLGLTKETASLRVNGETAIAVPLRMDCDDYINYINIGNNSATAIYLDEFLVISETTVDLSTDDADQKAADKVIALIKAIKNGDDTSAIKAASEAFDKLTLAQQDLVNMRVMANNGKSGLDGMVNYYELLRMYEDGDLITEKLIDEIGTVDQACGSRLIKAEEAYKSLTAAQKKKVDNYGTLRLARLRYDRIMSHKAFADAEAAEKVQEMIDAILLTNPMRYEKQITAARKAYNALSAEQMALVTNSKKLSEAEIKLAAQKKEFTRRSLASLQQLIDSLGDVDLYDLALVEGIRMKINSLTSEQKQTLNDRKLIEAEQKLAELKFGVNKKTLAQYRLEGVIKLIDSIGQVTMEKKGLIDAIRYSYDKLTVKQQEQVLNYTEFVKAEAMITSLLQLADTVPNTGDNNATATASHDYLMPMMLFSTLALAALVIFYFKKRNFR